MPLLWGRARPSSEGGMGGFDRGAHLDNVGLGIVANDVARVRRIARNSRARCSHARDVVLEQHAHFLTIPMSTRRFLFAERRRRSARRAGDHAAAWSLRLGRLNRWAAPSGFGRLWVKRPERIKPCLKRLTLRKVQLDSRSRSLRPSARLSLSRGDLRTT